MIRKLLVKLIRDYGTRRNVASSRNSKALSRRLGIESLESRRLLAVTGSISGFALLANGTGFNGLTVEISPLGDPSDVVGVTQTGYRAAAGAYSFNGLALGSYEVRIAPPPTLAVGKPSLGSAGSSDGSDAFTATLAAANPNATDYNFSILGAQAGEVSLRMFLATTGSQSQFLASLHAAPSVAAGGSGSPSASVDYTTGGAGADIASSNAAIAAPDSSTLTSMTITIENPRDGGSEQLSATSTDTALTVTPGTDDLTVTGVADLPTYESLLQSTTYGDASPSPTAGVRTLSIVVNDGTDSSAAVTSTVKVVLGAATIPAVSGVSPAQGPASGGTSVTITGANLASAKAVDFGGAAGTITSDTATQIIATSPAGTGAVDVTVTTAGETSATSSTDKFTYVTAPAPAVSGVSPAQGPAAGGTSVTITGANLASAKAVDFGGVAGTITSDTATQIVATSPAGTGAVDVTVTTAGGTSAASSADKFTFVAAPAPAVSGVSPAQGPAAGGTSVTIIGANLASAKTVDFGGVAGTITSDTATQIIATSPAGTGAVDVTVTTASGTSATSSADKFTYVAAPAPAVSGVSPAQGPAAGGTSVTITGANLASAKSVSFGGVAGTITGDTATQIIATSPTGTGAVDVTVATAGGTSATSSADKFTYVAAPAVSGVSPAQGPAAGGTSVTITGANLASAKAVDFGGVAGTITSDTATQIIATSPAGTGTVDVTVSTAGGTSATSSADKFTYVTAPAGTSLVSTGPGAFSITLHNGGSTPIGTFWYAWEPGEDFMPGPMPTNIKSPAGWTDTITGSGNSSDGYAIQWVATTSSAALPAGSSLSGFSFDSTLTLAQLTTSDSPFFPSTPVGTSVTYTGAPFSSSPQTIVV